MPSIRLQNRATLHVTGEAAEPFLQNLVTADLDRLAEGEARPGALLTPQGKVLFDFLLSRIDGGFRLDCARDARDDLKKRLTLYRLRAKVAIEPSEEAVGVSFEESAPAAAVRDQRFPEGDVARLYGELAEAADEAVAPGFRAKRIAAGVAEVEIDFPPGEMFPHDVLLDQNGGVSFKKGCFVGQEVVSRMQHRGTARRRIVVLRAESHITEGANVEAEGRPIGTVIGAAETVAMAVLRIDKLADTLREGGIVSVDGVPVEAEIPGWAGYALPSADAAASGADA